VEQRRPYFLVVRTSGIKEASHVPRDAVLHAEYWHPGDGDWSSTHYASIDELISDMEGGGFYKLLQITQTRPAPYAYELVFMTDRSSFEAPAASEPT